MSQHFLLSAKARTLSLVQVARMSDQEAWETFKAIRWADTDGAPVCPRCGCAEHYFDKAKKLWQCKGCKHRFTVTSSTIFASRKMPVRDLLMAIAVFSNGAKGISALQLSRDLNCQYKSAYVLAHKLREAMGAPNRTRTVRGEIEVDGCYVGGYVKPENRKEDRKDLRLKVNQSGKRRVVVAMRERKGVVLPFVFKSEDEAVPTIQQRVEPGSTVYADEAAAWDALHARFDTQRVNHSVAFMDKGVCTNMVESFFARLRRAEIGTHHRISGKYLGQYANEMAWRENHRRVSNGEQFTLIVSAALAHPVSRQWKGYWQRRAA